MHQQLWGYKVGEKLYLGVREQKRLNTIALEGPELTIPLSQTRIRHHLALVMEIQMFLVKW
jgi:hypothetical protein